MKAHEIFQRISTRLAAPIYFSPERTKDGLQAAIEGLANGRNLQRCLSSENRLSMHSQFRTARPKKFWRPPKERIAEAVEKLSAKYPAESAAVYLHAFQRMEDLSSGHRRGDSK